MYSTFHQERPSYIIDPLDHWKVSFLQAHSRCLASAGSITAGVSVWKSFADSKILDAPANENVIDSVNSCHTEYAKPEILDKAGCALCAERTIIPARTMKSKVLDWGAASSPVVSLPEPPQYRILWDLPGRSRNFEVVFFFFRRSNTKCQRQNVPRHLTD